MAKCCFCRKLIPGQNECVRIICGEVTKRSFSTGNFPDGEEEKLAHLYCLDEVFRENLTPSDSCPYCQRKLSGACLTFSLGFYSRGSWRRTKAGILVCALCAIDIITERTGELESVLGFPQACPI